MSRARGGRGFRILNRTGTFEHSARTRPELEQQKATLCPTDDKPCLTTPGRLSKDENGAGKRKSPDFSGLFSLLLGGASRSRTGLNGFAGRCITALLSRQKRTVRMPRRQATDFYSRTISPSNKKGSEASPLPGAGDESRTRDLNLGKVALYQLSYSRIVLHLQRFAVQHAARKSGAGDESRTRDLNLGKVALYQLSYSRMCPASAALCRTTRCQKNLERETSLELATSTLARLRSTN